MYYYIFIYTLKKYFNPEKFIFNKLVKILKFKSLKPRHFFKKVANE